MQMPTGGTAMVICADGAAQTIYVDANGVPVEPAAKCCPCLDCHAPVLFLNPESTDRPAPQLPRMLEPLVEADFSIALQFNTRPMPRGPPLQGWVAVAYTAQKGAPATFDPVEMYPGHAFGFGRHLLQGCPP